MKAILVGALKNIYKIPVRNVMTFALMHFVAQKLTHLA